MVTTLPAPIVAHSPIQTFSIIQQFGPIYTLSEIFAATPSFAPIVVYCDTLTLFPIFAEGLIIIGPACPIYKPYPTSVW